MPGRCNNGLRFEDNGDCITSCSNCGAGIFQPQAGQTSCSSCPSGTYGSATGATSASSCISCPAGYYYSTSLGDNGCRTGSCITSCSSCTAGSFQSQTGQPSCSSCPSGTYSTSQGMTSASTCTSCPVGYISVGISCTNTASICGTIKGGMCFNGQLLQINTLQVLNPAECCDACEKTPSCNVWTFSHSGGNCGLRLNVPTSEILPGNCTSGLNKGAEYVGPTPAPAPASATNTTTKETAGITIAVLVVVGGLIIVGIRWRNTKKANNEEHDSHYVEMTDLDGFDPDTGLPLPGSSRIQAESLPAHVSVSEPPPPFHVTYADIDLATGGFSSTHAMAKGGSCEVYRATLLGVGVAIKVMMEETQKGSDSSQCSVLSLDEKQLLAETTLLKAVSHANICKLLAVSVDGPRRCIVLELCIGGALNGRLKKEKGLIEGTLSWQKRIQIGIGIGRALNHLHSLKPSMIHRDVKSQNVLLAHFDHADMTSVTKLADFGTVREDIRHRRVQQEQTNQALNMKTHASTKNIIGTCVYMPNEYITYGHVSVKTDSFAYGLVLMELLGDFTGYDARCLREGVDVSGNETAKFSFESLAANTNITKYRWPSMVLRGLVHIIGKCTEVKASDRLAVADVLQRVEMLLLIAKDEK